MNDNEVNAPKRPPRGVPWNKDKHVASKPPLKSSHVLSIRTKMKMDHRTRDLAWFNLAIDRKLRGCDLVALRVDDVAPHGRVADRANVRQKKTGRPVCFELTEQTRVTLNAYLQLTGRGPGQWLFPGQRLGSWKALSLKLPAAAVLTSLLWPTPVHAQSYAQPPIDKAVNPGEYVTSASGGFTEAVAIEVPDFHAVEPSLSLNCDSNAAHHLCGGHQHLVPLRA